MCPDGSNIGPLVASTLIPYLPNTKCLKEHTLIRITVEIQLKTSFTPYRDFVREAAKTYREVIDLTSRDNFYLEVEVWKILGKKELPVSTLMKKFLKKVVLEVYQIEPRLKTNELFFVITTIYKIVTRHLFHLENLLGMQLSDKLKQLINKQSAFTHQPLFHRVIQLTLEKLIYCDQTSDNKTDCRQWNSLPAFSELELKEWEELIWMYSMRVKYKTMTHASSTVCYPLIGRLLSEIKRLQPDALEKELASTIIFLQKEYSFIASMSRKEFIATIDSINSNLSNLRLRHQEDPSLYPFLERHIKEVLRFSKNLDQIFDTVSDAYRRARDLPFLNGVELKTAIDVSRQGVLSNATLQNFIQDAFKHSLSLNTSHTEASASKDVAKLYHEATSLPPLNEEELALNIYAALMHYVELHPLHNSIRPISLGISFASA
ncbi:MAG: hypothetical protein JHC93_01660 [Parachlamydiales bacterium]|nr:hypothetical protein [Parachlamydiales bacterium]